MISGPREDLFQLLWVIRFESGAGVDILLAWRGKVDLLFTSFYSLTEILMRERGL